MLSVLIYLREDRELTYRNPDGWKANSRFRRDRVRARPEYGSDADAVNDHEGDDDGADNG